MVSNKKLNFDPDLILSVQKKQQQQQPGMRGAQNEQQKQRLLQQQQMEMMNQPMPEDMIGAIKIKDGLFIGDSFAA